MIFTSRIIIEKSNPINTSSGTKQKTYEEKDDANNTRSRVLSPLVLLQIGYYIGDGRSGGFDRSHHVIDANYEDHNEEENSPKRRDFKRRDGVREENKSEAFARLNDCIYWLTSVLGQIA